MALVVVGGTCVYGAAITGYMGYMGLLFVIAMSIVFLCNTDPRDIELRRSVAEYQAIEDSKIMRGIRDKAERRMATELLESQGYKVVKPE